MIRSVLILLGRVFMGSIFVAGALWHFMNWELALQKTAATGTPYPSVILGVATFLLICGGLSILVGYRTSLGATLLLCEVVATAFLLQKFWVLKGMEMQFALLSFLKYMALAGGLLFLLADGPGKICVDTFRSRKRNRAYLKNN